MSSEASKLAHETTEMLAFVCEGFCFVYFGLSSVKYWTQDTFSIGRNGTYTVGLLVVRVLVVGFVSVVLRFVSPGPHRLSAGELLVVGLGGAMRGILAYALVQQAIPKSNPSSEDEKMLMCVLFVVLMHTCFGGLVFPLALRKLPPEVEPRSVELQDQSDVQSELRLTRTPGWLSDFKDKWHAFDETYLQPYVGEPRPERYAHVIARVRGLSPPSIGSAAPFLETHTPAQEPDA